MRRRALSVCCTFLLVIGMLLISANNAQAASEDPILDGSYLTFDEESVGYATPLTRVWIWRWVIPSASG